MSKYEWVDTITLPERTINDMGLKGCHICDQLMIPSVITADFSLGGRNFKVRNVRAWKCAGCGEVIYSSAEAKLIEEAIHETLESD